MNSKEFNNKEENKLSYLIRGEAINIHRELGPGLFESVYEKALVFKLRAIGLAVESQVKVPVFYEGIQLDIGFRLDIVVNKLLIVEVKSVELITKLHSKQLLNYLRLTNLRLGLLINFNSEILSKSIWRVVNDL